MFKYVDKRQKYLCEFNWQMLNILNIGKNDIKNLHIGLSLMIESYVSRSNINIDDNGVNVIKGFITTEFPKYSTIGVYCNKYMEYDKDIFIDRGIGVIDLGDITKHLSSPEKGFIDISHAESSLRNLICKCDKIVIIHNSDIADLINSTNNYDLLSTSARLIALHSHDLGIPVYLANQYYPLNGKLLQKRDISQ